MSADPTAEHIDAVARGLRAAGVEVGYVGGDRFRQEVARRLLTSTDPAVHAALAAFLPAEVMLAALVDRGTLTEEWAVQYERGLSTPTMSGATEATATTQVLNEDRARQAVRHHAPINARNRRAVSRLVTPWEVAP